MKDIHAGTEAIARVANVPFCSVHTVMEDYQIIVSVLLMATATAEGAVNREAAKIR